MQHGNAGQNEDHVDEDFLSLTPAFVASATPVRNGQSCAG
jgi:hypothetical protein